MSEIYLTKIERKTIFTRSLIFVLVMFIISDLTVTGPFWFNFIPWMYIVGTIGSIKKIDSALMCIIGTFTVFAASLIMQGEVNTECLISTVITLITLVLGIITGKFIYEFILEHRLVKYIKRSKKIIYIALGVVMFLSSYVMVSLNSGDIITYLKSRANVKEYIDVTYGDVEYRIVDANYSTYVAGKYIHEVQAEGHKIYFVPVTKTIFKDLNKDTRRLNLIRDIQDETSLKITDIQNKYSHIQDAYIRYTLEYGDVSFMPDITVLGIDYKKIDETTDLNKLYEQTDSVITELQNIKQFQKVVITLQDKVLEITNENIANITPEYIKGGFEIEEISE